MYQPYLQGMRNGENSIIKSNNMGFEDTKIKYQNPIVLILAGGLFSR